MSSHRDKFKKRPFLFIHCSDLDDILKSEFPHWQHGYFISAKEAPEGVFVEIDVEPELDPYSREEAEKFIETGVDEAGYGLPDFLLSILCERGDIDAGRYLVEVSW